MTLGEFFGFHHPFFYQVSRNTLFSLIKFQGLMESLPTTAAALGCWSRKARLIQQIRFGNAGTLLAHGYDSGYDTFLNMGYMAMIMLLGHL